ncbi:hypothetical protein K493DRAFT_312246 [Basidiobolus meristosporus CBS 931.73]|uniref:MD-2-related lipid-recognition domain-containing protein n=1 Tax=Basidiobolus meristosporus CBS 931.73 TaxID=1314790 RepID=A0A1Y1YUY3_9FUNG|nr:hypothetical protein K493DRAFT_312246 [Basidiobolus meristosporus CBS 931.73]|eukprot:ORY01852.1 hypothetical protein K493DRAFT_312246 [Basidiobolus meristosporus CBS 931.73]
MFMSTLLSLAMVGVSFSAPFPYICKPNVEIEGTRVTNAGCSIKLELAISSGILSTVSSLDVKLYKGNSPRGILVHQVQTKGTQAGQGNVEILFPVGSEYLGNNTLIVTETSRKQTQCPRVYGTHGLRVLPASGDVMCIF